MKKIEVDQLPVTSLRPYPRNARVHSQKQIAQIAASIRTFGFNNPVLIDEDGVVRSMPMHRVREVFRDGELIWKREPGRT